MDVAIEHLSAKEQIAWRHVKECYGSQGRYPISLDCCVLLGYSDSDKAAVAIKRVREAGG
jgi:hypothetical protein